MKSCPYCEQFDLWIVTISGVDGNAVMCRECDTVWWNEQIVNGKGTTFDEFMKARGLDDDWKKVVWVSMIKD